MVFFRNIEAIFNRGSYKVKDIMNMQDIDYL